VPPRVPPSPVGPAYAPAADRHGVHLYETDDEIVESVSDLLETAVAVGDAVVLVATAAHRAAVEAELRRRGMPLGPGSYLPLDAESTLESLLVDGVPDRDRFRSVVASHVEELAAEGQGVTIYGEMVGLLWDRGQALAAMTLEGFWNELGAQQSFVLLCGYRTDDSDCRWDLEDVRGSHSHVMSSGV
jgi:hypothetical protein